MLKDQKWLEEENRVDRIYSKRGRKNLQKLLVRIFFKEEPVT